MLWRDIGGAVTIHCRSSESDPKELNVKKGLSKDFLKVDKSNTVTMTKGLTHRLHVNATFPDVDILIQNLNMDDTGLYWCLYRKGDQRSAITENTNYSLLVVKGKPHHFISTKQMDPTNKCYCSNTGYSFLPN